ncbi:MAG: flippase-like domain-containing protein [Acidobacteria bacterium]|nr:flippase-like domain-containing protein [Acidobacteriota bacterium]
MLIARLDLDRAAALMFGASLPVITATLVALSAANLVVALRWHLILSAVEPSPGPGALLKLVFVGLFFNQVLPTGIGGDAVRAWRCTKLGIALGPAIRSILLDRATGYLVLVAVYGAALPSLLRVLPQASERISVAIVFGVALLALIVLVSLDRMPRIMLQFRFIEPLIALARESRRLLMRPRRCSAIMSLSLLSIGCLIFAFKFAADSVHSHVSPVTWLMVVPPVTLIQLVPVSLAGWGVREAALVVALGAFGVPAEAALATSVMMGLCSILSGLPGGLIWLCDWDISPVRLTPIDNAAERR